MMHERGFVLAGWVSVVIAVTMVPSLGFLFLVEFSPEQFGGMGWSGLVFALDFIQAAASIFLLLELRRLLNRWNFHQIDSLVTVMVAGSILVFLIPDSWWALGVVVLLALCAVSVVFGLRLLRFKEDPTGRLKLYASLTISISVAMATVVLLPIALILCLVSAIVQAMIFFDAEHLAPNNLSASDPGSPHGPALGPAAASSG